MPLQAISRNNASMRMSGMCTSFAGSSRPNLSRVEMDSFHSTYLERGVVTGSGHGKNARGYHVIIVTVWGSKVQ